MQEKHFKTCLSIGLLAIVLLSAGNSFAVELADDDLFIHHGGKVHIMRRVFGKSGKTDQIYEAAGDPRTYFKSSRNGAELSVEGCKFSKYTLIRDTKDEDKIIFTADGVNYTLNRVRTASGAKYEAPGDPNTYFWSKGESAALFIKGKPYAGYDVWLPSGGIALTGEGIPTEVEFHVKSINDEPIKKGSKITITFHQDGSLTGMASVNDYKLSWSESGGKITVKDGVTTFKAAHPNLMEQEKLFLKTLSDVESFRFLKDGVFLFASDGSSITLTFSA
jgi:putative lipoprotein